MSIAEFRDHDREMHRFRSRIAAAGVIVLTAFGILLGRFAYLQFFKHDYYQTKAEDNRISIVPILPNRGLILDRNGVVLARNYSAYTLEINPNKVANVEETIRDLSKIMDIEARDRNRFRKLRAELKGAESLPIRTRLSEKDVAQFAANAYRFPGVEIKARLYRQYPYGELASHAMGYLGRINDRDLEKLEEDEQLVNYKGTDHIGKTGLEQFYEYELHGVTGSAQVEIDANGKGIRTISSKAPIPGNNLTLTLDAKLQELAEQAFGNYRGALVAIEPATGGVLAFVSKPGYDPNLFVDGIDSESWNELNKSIDRPLNNRAINGAYPPGSTFKPFMALMALELGKRTPEYTISDPGYFTLPGQGHRYRDWKVGGHGVVNLHKSVVISCDTYYYGLAVDTDIDQLHAFMSQLGFGRPTGIDIKGESSGLLPSRAWKKKRFKTPGEQKWYTGDSVSVGIGQGYNLATPMQLAYATAVLANNGVAFKPHLVRTVTDVRTGTQRVIEPEPVRTVPLNQKWVNLVKAAMVDVTRPGGTASVAGRGTPYSFAGKTGTAQVIGIKQGEKYDERRISERFHDHALFVAFAPADQPKIAIGIMVENGKHGSSTAAPIARLVFDYHLLGKLPAKPVAPEAEEGEDE
ncbi:MAG TPA: penicillin-binding protein 2 [Burkholderiales bacterium]|nr:penicillin-binding protein 2 [Burkholderiales bacterium]